MSHINRVTSLRIVDDLEDEAMFYEAMGGERIATTSPNSIAYKAANDTGVILSSLRSTIAIYGPFIANMLAREGARYMPVDDIDDYLRTLPEAKIIARATVHGVDEAIIDTDGNLVVLASVSEMAEA